MVKNKDALFTSNSTEWETPQWLFNELNARYNFTLDACASKKNAKCERYFSKENNCLFKDWGTNRVFMNPPYGKDIYWFVKKAYDAAMKGAIVVALLPSRTDTKWWHEFCIKAERIFFIKGRLKFGDSKNSAPFPSAIVVFRNPTISDFFVQCFTFKITATGLISM